MVVERIEGRPVCGMRVGDWFELTQSSRLRTCPGRFFCVYALAAVLPLLAAKQRELAPGDWLSSRQPRGLPGSRRAADHADRAHRPVHGAAARRHVSLGSGRRELSIALQSDEDLATYASLAPRIEELGFAAISVYADLLYPSPLLPLITIAQATRRIRLGPACLNPYLLHPVEIANQLHILDLVSGGRAYLGLARGAWLDAVGITQERPVRRLREAVEVVRHLLRRPRRRLRGRDLPAGAGRAPGLPPGCGRDVDLLLGAWGPLGMSLAGELAAEVKIGGTANPALLPAARQALARGAARAGRPPGAAGLVCGAVTVVDEDGPAARRLARAEVATYLPVVAAARPGQRRPARGPSSRRCSGWSARVTTTGAGGSCPARFSTGSRSPGRRSRSPRRRRRCCRPGRPGRVRHAARPDRGRAASSCSAGGCCPRPRAAG